MRRNGFSVIELLIAVLIIGIIAAIAMGNYVAATACSIIDGRGDFEVADFPLILVVTGVPVGDEVDVERTQDRAQTGRQCDPIAGVSAEDVAAPLNGERLRGLIACGRFGQEAPERSGIAGIVVSSFPAEGPMIMSET